MSKISKRLKEARAKIELGKAYPIEEAVKLVKETSKVKFDASVEVHVKLGIDPKKSDQIIRDSIILPHGTGKILKVAAFVPEDKIKEAKAAGADIAGADDFINEIKKDGKYNFDIAVTVPEMMKSLAAIARILGQKGLMPNPKVGTISPDLKKMIGELKKGKVNYKNDDTGNLHLLIGKTSFDDKALVENLQTFLDSLKKIKPASVKGVFIKSMIIASSMGPGIRVATN